jgi:hypothetical protein
MDAAGSSNSASAPGRLQQPSSCTLALLLQAAAATRDGSLLQGVWQHFGGGSYMQQQQSGASSSSSSSSSDANQGMAPIVMHALMHGAVLCDLAAAGVTRNSSSSSSSSSSGGGSGGGSSMRAPGGTSVAAVLFHPGSLTVSLMQQLQQLQLRSEQPEQGQQQQQQQRRASLPVPLLHPCQASELLRLCSSAADVDLLLLSPLCQPGGLPAQELVSLQQQLSTHVRDAAQRQRLAGTVASAHMRGHSSSSRSSSSGSAYLVGTPHRQQPLVHLLEQLPSAAQGAAHLPVFPPPLRADVARAAVGAFLRFGELGRAAAVAHVAAVAHPRDVQQYDLLVRGAAATGAALPALVLVRRLREALWLLPAPKAQAAMLR